MDYPRYGYASGYGGGGYDVHDNINGLDWGTNDGYGDGVYGMGGHDGINIAGKVIWIFSWRAFDIYVMGIDEF